MYIIEFEPPVDNVVGTFNTFRLGLKWSKVLTPGDHVLLADSKKKYAFGEAAVIEIKTGTLEYTAHMYAQLNHNQQGIDPVDAAPMRLIERMQRRYGPHIAELHKKTTVIFLKRIS